MSDAITRLADEIVESLFTDGVGTKARRLVLELPDGSMRVGGWGKSGVHSVVVSALRKYESTRPAAGEKEQRA